MSDVEVIDHDDPGQEIAVREPQLMLRFLAKCERPSDWECWTWTGSRNRAPMDYGRFRVGARRPCAHRVSYELFKGPIPDRMTLDHLCRTPSCVNPFHLDAVTLTENIRRGTQGHIQRNTTHCPRNHPYDTTNTRIDKKGGRICRACAREKDRESRRTP